MEYRWDEGGDEGVEGKGEAHERDSERGEEVTGTEKRG